MILKLFKLYALSACLLLAPVLGRAQSAVIGLPSGSGDYNALTNKPAIPAGPTGQVLYNATSDTVASIETACSSLCTYVVTVPQTITLAANHTLSSNVQLDFRAGGKWTVNGAFTLTIPGNVTGTLNQHFAGTSTIKFGLIQATAPVEWFGAVGDWNGTTGTDNTTAIQAAINSLGAGQAVLQQKAYKITSPLTITSSYVGIRGTITGGIIAGGVAGTTYPSVIISSSASADILDVGGTDTTHNTEYNRIEDISLERSVAPSGTATGLSLNWTEGAVVDRVTSMDSVRNLYAHASPSFGMGHISHFWSAWGYNGVTEGAGTTLYGINLDSSDGVAENSISIDNSASTSGLSLSTGPTTWCAIISGTAINDVDFTSVGTGGCSYGVGISYTGTGTVGTDSDLHFLNVTNDSFGISGFFIQNLSAAGYATVNIIDGWSVGLTASGHAIDIESSSGVNVIGHQMSTPAGGAALYANGSSNIAVTASVFPNAATGAILFNNTSSSSLTGNTINSLSGTSKLMNFTGSSTNSVTGNSLKGTASVGIFFDGSSNNNNGANLNTIASSVTTPYTDTTATNVLSGGSGAVTKIAEQVLGTTAATITFSSIPGTYRNLEVVVNGRTDNTNPNVKINFNGDSGANYEWQQFYTNNTTAAGVQGLATTAGNLGNIAISSAAAGMAGSITARIYNYAGTTFNKNVYAQNGYDFSTGVVYAIDTVSIWKSTAAITSIVIAPGAGNFIAGSTFTLYGIN